MPAHATHPTRRLRALLLVACCCVLGAAAAPAANATAGSGSAKPAAARSACPVPAKQLATPAAVKTVKAGCDSSKLKGDKLCSSCYCALSTNLVTSLAKANVTKASTTNESEEARDLLWDVCSNRMLNALAAGGALSLRELDALKGAACHMAAPAFRADCGPYANATRLLGRKVAASNATAAPNGTIVVIEEEEIIEQPAAGPGGAPGSGGAASPAKSGAPRRAASAGAAAAAAVACFVLSVILVV